LVTEEWLAMCTTAPTAGVTPSGRRTMPRRCRTSTGDVGREHLVLVGDLARRRAALPRDLVLRLDREAADEHALEANVPSTSRS
jgi:hypothetical protein